MYIQPNVTPWSRPQQPGVGTLGSALTGSAPQLPQWLQMQQGLQAPSTPGPGTLTDALAGSAPQYSTPWGNTLGSSGQAAPWLHLPQMQQALMQQQQQQALMQQQQQAQMMQQQGVQAPGNPYLSQGTSSGIAGFNPLQANGNFYPGLLGDGTDQAVPQQSQQLQPPQQWQVTGGIGGGQVYANEYAARQAARRNRYDEAESPGSGMSRATRLDYT